MDVDALATAGVLQHRVYGVYSIFDPRIRSWMIDLDSKLPLAAKELANEFVVCLRGGGPRLTGRISVDGYGQRLACIDGFFGFQGRGGGPVQNVGPWNSVGTG